MTVIRDYKLSSYRRHDINWVVLMYYITSSQNHFNNLCHTLRPYKTFRNLCNIFHRLKNNPVIDVIMSGLDVKYSGAH